MAGIRTENKIYEVGIYCRLSKDDGTDNESASIATQKSILTDYVKRQGWHLAKTYVDDGYSGTNFQRPSFQNMIKDIENGLINCVITKDLSRLGRNYLDCGLYLEVFFPEHNVRYIAVNDGVDTLNKSAMDITPFRNILNEMYSADVSVKIKSAYRARFQQGKFMGTTAPYGYVKDPADHNHLLIDDKVAHVVREIFDLALAGNGIAKIRKHINKQHILRPAAYAVEQGATGYERYFEDNEENRYIWSENSVRGILRSPIYAGNLAGYKRIAANMKSKKRPSKLPEEWEVIPDTHEGIVTQEEFDTVQQLMTSRRREQNAGGFENIFSGVIKCADCGYAMRAASANRRKRPDIIDCVQYTCNNYGRYGNVMCTAHSIEARDLFNAVLADINRFADMAVNDEKAVRAIERRLTETDQSRAKSLEKEKKKLNKRLAELDRLFSSLYEDKVMERITERNFEMMSGKYQKEQLEIEARLKEVTETLNDSYEKSQGVRDFLSLIRNYQGLKELDATIINALIDKILVSEREKLADGTVRQEIKIYYKFIGFVGELHITPTKRWTALKPKNCTVCGVEYVPSSGISKYCPACAKRIQREKSNESKRRSRERNRRACIELSAKNDRLNWDTGGTLSQFCSITFKKMYRDGICQVADSYYTKMVEFYDINYDLLEVEDQADILEEYSKLINCFDPSIKFQLFLFNRQVSEQALAEQFDISLQGDAFDDIRDEYTQMLKHQSAKGNNGIIKSKYLIFGVESAGYREAKSKLSNIEKDVVHNLNNIGTNARGLDGKERLRILHEYFNQGTMEPFRFLRSCRSPGSRSRTILRRRGLTSAIRAALSPTASTGACLTFIHLGGEQPGKKQAGAF